MNYTVKDFTDAYKNIKWKPKSGWFFYLKTKECCPLAALALSKGYDDKQGTNTILIKKILDINNVQFYGFLCGVDNSKVISSIRDESPLEFGLARELGIKVREQLIKEL